MIDKCRLLKLPTYLFLRPQFGMATAPRSYSRTETERNNLLLMVLVLWYWRIRHACELCYFLLQQLRIGFKHNFIILFFCGNEIFKNSYHGSEDLEYLKKKRIFCRLFPFEVTFLFKFAALASPTSQMCFHFLFLTLMAVQPTEMKKRIAPQFKSSRCSWFVRAVQPDPVHMTGAMMEWSPIFFQWRGHQSRSSAQNHPTCQHISEQRIIPIRFNWLIPQACARH